MIGCNYKASLLLIVIFCQLILAQSYFEAGFLYMQNKTIDPLAIELTFRASSTCQCRKECIESEGCALYSWKKINSLITMCYIGGSNTSLSTLCNKTQSTVGFKVGYPAVQMGQDNLVYWLIGGNYTFDEGKALCSQRPGFRLGIYKTKLSIDVLVSLNMANVWVDLTKTQSLDGIWGDGTMYTSTEASNVTHIDKLGANSGEMFFRWSGTMFADKDNTAKFNVQCQTDLFQTLSYAVLSAPALG